MRWMRCPDCHAPISWVPRLNGVRVPIEVKPVPDGDYYFGPRGHLLRVPENLARDVPRYAIHIPCPHGAIA